MANSAVAAGRAGVAPAPLVRDDDAGRGGRRISADAIRYDPRRAGSQSYYLAPLQMKATGGVLVIDDFGRQRISTTELLNRWIIPLEKGHDYIMLPSGRHIQIPFAQLLVFSTNLDPRQIVLVHGDPPALDWLATRGDVPAIG